ncbi:hypothetical protein CNMCM7691_002043 [Aspergillus felis]|uniref:Uncharacterized protein n=1 Tax=Aspergillus felis TaxID=1287682 RepID=A0A8H6V837_9EURO|nr:hypothetical protein CNMCM7691_002043 [Aspergillus felis]
MVSMDLMFTQQHRMANRLFDMVSGMFYVSQLSTTESLDDSVGHRQKLDKHGHNRLSFWSPPPSETDPQHAKAAPVIDLSAWSSISRRSRKTMVVWTCCLGLISFPPAIPRENDNATWREDFEQLQRYMRHMVAQHPWRHPQYSIIAVGRYVEFLTIVTQVNSAEDSSDDTLDDNMLPIKQLASLQETAETINAEDMPTCQKYT